MKRFFLVGCPRSGTTLLQSLIAAHPAIASFPESHFFTRVVSSCALLRRLGIASFRARNIFYKFLEDINHPDFYYYLPKVSVFTQQYARAFLRVLDTVALRQGKSSWLEKTPRHLHYIDDIAALVPGAKFIHLIRNGPDVIASLHDVASKYPGIWKSIVPVDIDQCIQRWTTDIKITQRYLGTRDHFLVRYEQLVAEPQQVLSQLFRFLTIPYCDSVFREYRNVNATLVYKNESWKQSTGRVIKSANDSKFFLLFNEDERAYINQRLRELELKHLID